MSYGLSCSASGCESWWAMLRQWVWIMVCYAEPVVMSHGVLWWARGCESWCVILSQWLWIMVWYGEPVIVNYTVLCLWIMTSNTEPLAVNHGLLCCASGCELWWFIFCQVCEWWCAMISQWVWIMLCYTDWCVMLSHGLWIMVSHDETVAVNRRVLCLASGCVSWCVMLSQWL